MNKIMAIIKTKLMNFYPWKIVSQLKFIGTKKIIMNNFTIQMIQKRNINMRLSQ